MSDEARESAKRSILSVGDGRGFVVDGAFGQHFVITAAHCLPTVPPPHLGRDRDEYTFEKLLAPLGEKPSVSAECVFVDTIADIAVLSAPWESPYDPEFETPEFEKMTEALPAMTLAVLPDLSYGKVTAGQYSERIREERRAWVLSLDGRWIECAATYDGRLFTITNGIEHVVDSISGSPIIAESGAAIGLVSTVRTTASDAALRNAGASWQTRSPGLIDSLPGWLLNEILGDANIRRREMTAYGGARSLLGNHRVWIMVAICFAFLLGFLVARG
jgi:hypothetical protein